MLQIKELKFIHDDTNRGVKGVSFESKEGEITALLGKSGSGKSTLLKLLYGLEDIQEGSILLDGDEVQGPSGNIVPGHERMQLVRQDVKVLPNHTVYENIEQSIATSGGEANKFEIKKLLKQFDLDWDMDKKPKELSGGQQQKLAIARALAAEPEVLLLDEPFNQIDVLERAVIIERIRDYVKEGGRTCILATHSGDEALDLADNIIVMYEGMKVEEGTPEKCYNTPEKAITAGFLGPINLMRTVQGQFAAKGMKFLVRPIDMFVDDDGHDHRVISCIPSARGFLVKLRFSKTEVRYVYSDEQVDRGTYCGLRAKPKDYHTVSV